MDAVSSCQGTLPMTPSFMNIVTSIDPDLSDTIQYHNHLGLEILFHSSSMLLEFSFAVSLCEWSYCSGIEPHVAPQVMRPHFVGHRLQPRHGCNI